jgi:cytochrome c5
MSRCQKPTRRYQGISLMRVVPVLSAAFVVLAGIVVMPVLAGAQGALPPGDGRDLVATACSQCHSLNIFASMREGEAGWTRHVHTMIMRGAQLTPSEASQAITYLATHLGPGVPPTHGNAANAAAITLPPGAGMELVATRCTLCHDLERVVIARRRDWPGLVANMVNRGATATPDEARTIATYLAAHFSDDGQSR